MSDFSSNIGLHLDKQGLPKLDDMDCDWQSMGELGIFLRELGISAYRSGNHSDAGMLILSAASMMLFGQIMRENNFTFSVVDVDKLTRN